MERVNLQEGWRFAKANSNEWTPVDLLDDQRSIACIGKVKVIVYFTICFVDSSEIVAGFDEC